MANIEDLRDRSVSSGTLKSDDLIPKFLDVLKTYGKDKYDAYIKENPEVLEWKDLDDETQAWVVDELIDLLNDIAPEDCYFGANEGDGADFGFWSMSNESKKSEKKDDYALFFETRVPGELTGARMFLTDMWNKMGNKKPRITFETEDPDFDSFVSHPTARVFVCGDTRSIASYAKYLLAHYDEIPKDFEGRWVWKDDLAYFARGFKEPSEAKKSEVAEGSDYFVIVFTSNEDAAKGAEYARNLGEDPQLPPGGKAVYVYGNDRDALKAFGKKWFDLCVDDDLGTTSTFGLNAKDESKKSEADGNKDIFTLDLTRIYADGDEVGLDDMQAAQNFYDEDEAIQAAKDLADSYKDDDDVVQVTVMAGEQEKPNGDIVGDSFDIFTASSSDSATTAKYREKAGYTKTDGLDYYAKGGKSEGNDDDKGCKGKDCKDDKTKKNEADATFKVGDFVNYDAESDGKEDLLNPMVYAEVSSVNDDGTLDLWVRDYDDGGKEVKGADTQFCDKLDHFAGMTDADHYYTGGRLNLYAGYYEIFITDKKLGKPYVFSGTIDDLGEKDAVDIYYDTISFVDKSLEDECRDWYWFDEDDPEGSKVIDMSDMVNPVESKKSEARPTKQDAQIKELCKLCRNDKNVADSVFKALTKDYNTSLDPVLAGQYLMATWKSKLEELGGCNGWYDGFKKLYAAMGSDFVCSVLQDLKLGSSEIGCGACMTIVDTIYDKVVKRNEAKKSEDFDMNQAFFQAKKAITDWTKRQGHKTLEWLYTDGRKSPTSYPSGIWDFEWDTGNGMATAELKVSPYETRTNSWNNSMDFGLRVGTEDKPTFYTSVEDVLYALDTLISKTEIKMESKKSEYYQDWIAFYFCKDSQGAEYAVYPQDVRNRNGNTVVGLQSRNGYHTGYRKEYILNSLTPIPLDEVDDSAIYKQLDDGEDREIIAIDKKDAERIMNASNPLSELKKVVHEYDIFYKGEGIANVKKSESLTLKQKELKDMARFGQAEDITTISDAEAKELKKKGIETVGISRGTYGMNGALLRDNEGNKYVITARSSNLFYFV